MSENTTLEEDGEEKKDDIGATPQISGSSSTIPAAHNIEEDDDDASNERDLVLLSRRLEEVEKDRNRLKQALEYSEDTNARLTAENVKLKQQQPNIDTVSSPVHGERPDSAGEIAEEEPTMKQQQQGNEEGYKIEIERLQTELDQIKNESTIEIAALKTEIVKLKDSEAALIETKERLASRVKDLLADTINSKMFCEYAPSSGAPAQVTTPTTVSAGHENQQQRQRVTSNDDTVTRNNGTIPPSTDSSNNHLDTAIDELSDGAKEQSDLIAVAAFKNKRHSKIRRSGFMKINPFADDDELDYGYKIPMPTEEEFAASEFLGKDVYVTSKGGDMKDDNDSHDSFEVSLELDDEQQADLIRAAAERKKTFFDKLFGE